MLEPAVRPGLSGPASSGPAGKPAFEHRTFEQLLAEAGEAEAPSEVDGPATQQSPAALVALSGLGRIENAALRGLLGQSGGSVDAAGSTGSAGRPA